MFSKDILIAIEFHYNSAFQATVQNKQSHILYFEWSENQYSVNESLHVIIDLNTIQDLKVYTLCMHVNYYILSLIDQI